MKFLQWGLHRFVQYQKFILYCVIGFTGVGVDYAVFTSVHLLLGIHYQIANVLSMTAGAVNNYSLNAWFNFKIKDHFFQRMLKFYVIALFGMVVTAVSLHVSVEWLHIPVLIAKAILIIVIAVMQYNINKRLTFSTRPTR